jgi:hypothetical protein
MSWLDGKIAQAKEAKAAQFDLDENAPKLYEALWRELSALVNEANTKGFGLDKSGSGHDLSIEVLSSEFSERGRTARLALAPDQRKIVASGSVSFSFEITFCDGRIVCLQLDDAQISAREAAQKIMEALLFP